MADKVPFNLSLLHASDYNLISNCINLYMQYLDQGNGKQFAELFVDGEGLCEIPAANIRKQGREEIASFCEATHAKFSTAYHFEANVVIEFKSTSQATNRSYWQAIDKGIIISYGLHEDVFERQDGDTPVWRFLTRKIVVLWRKEAWELCRIRELASLAMD